MPNRAEGQPACLRLLVWSHLEHIPGERVPLTPSIVAVSGESCATRRVRLEAGSTRGAVAEAIRVVPALALMVREAVLRPEVCRRRPRPSSLLQLRSGDLVVRAAVRIQ